MTMKKNIKWSFQPAQWLSSAEEEDVFFAKLTWVNIEINYSYQNTL